MIENNPGKIKKAEIVAGIPSFNEADNIAFVTKQIDRGLQKYFSQKTTVIINSDNNSPDNTGKVFLQTKTKSHKIYISTPAGQQGKGNNLKNLFLKIKDLEATAAMTVDADLKSINPEWIKCLLEPIVSGYDFVSPTYHRHKNDGSITNHLAYPLIYGLLGYNISQPIGGDMAFSKRMVEYWLKQKWFNTTKNYGIDIFMTSNAVKSGFNLAQVNLGSKIHKPSLPKLDKMFLEVADTLFAFLSANKNLWLKKINFKIPPLVCQIPKKSSSTKAKNCFFIDYRIIEKIAISEFLKNYEPVKEDILPEIRERLEKIFLHEKSFEIDIALWTKIVYQALYLYQTDSKKNLAIKLLRALYFARMASTIKDNSNKTQAEAEKIIQSQAGHFLKTRDYLLSLIASK